ncbi:MAG: DUF1835 domain-containing protein [Pyrinomonadaceae bacterium]
MIYHVLPGDSLAEEFKKTGIAGEVIVFREALVVGPLDGATPDEFWDQRAQFILSEYAEDEIVFHERVADEIEKLADVTADDEVNLWFEYELFCGVNMWFCLAKLADSGANIYRVEPATLSEGDRWLGFGKMEAGELQRCFDTRQLFAASDIKLGNDLWNAFSRRDFKSIPELITNESPRFPYLAEVAQAAAEIESKPLEILSEIRSEGIKDFEHIFPEFSKRAGVYGFGDLQVQRLLERSE